MSTFSTRYSGLFKTEGYTLNVLLGLALLIFSFIVCHYASEYATQVASNAVSDLLLDYLPIQDVSLIHVYAAFAFWFLFILNLLINRPEYIPFISKTASVFILVRSAFICLTHLGAPVNSLAIPTFSSFLIFNGDLFFSGHVGGPFLLALIFWQQIKLRYFYLGMSIFFAYTVLAGHIHYSIDVVAAPFITYGVYQFSRVFFAKDYNRTKSNRTLRI